MSAARPAVYTVPAGVGFVGAIAGGLLERAGSDPLELSRATVLLPTRRACRALQEAFLRASGGRPLLLPRLRPLGDLDAEELLLAGEEAPEAAALEAELPAAMPRLRRQLLLAQLVLRWGRGPGDDRAPSEDQAARLAEELARLLDQVETEGLDLASLHTLVPERYAEHWQLTLRFLSILAEHWPRIQAAHGCIGPAERRRRLLEAQAEAWRRQPPQAPVIAAGSTGSIPATAALLAVVAGLPQGAVVLPGLDRAADDASWRAAAAEPTHPQYALARLLERLQVGREQVADWPGGGGAPAPEATMRARLASAALEPAETTPRWRDLDAELDAASLQRALAGVRRIDCPGPREEAAVIALLLRRAVEDEGRTAALVTPDRALARRVAAELRRWEIAVDDSGGTPLGQTAPGSYLRLTARMLAEGLAPLPLLSALKHPLAAGGLAPGDFRARVRRLEVAVLRGPRPPAGFDGLLRALEGAEAEPDLVEWLARLKRLAAPAEATLTGARGGLAEAFEAHLGFAERLAATDAEDGAARLWAGEAGEAAAGFVAELREAAVDASGFGGARYAALLDGLMAGRAVRPRFGRHPRIAIWGPLEARLQGPDLVVLGGLNEGTWPAEVDPGPWLSRPMQEDFGLPPPERRIGLAAHDFAQMFCAPQVVLTRSTRVEGTPTVPSRWLLRLRAVLAAVGLPEALGVDQGRWLGWAEALDDPQAVAPADPPAPRPPREARPRRLSVTRVETWMRDPYALYAEQVLGLTALEPLDADPGAAEHGSAVHEALEAFVRAYAEGLPADAEAVLLDCGERAFRKLRARPGALAFWWPRFRRIAGWFIAAERDRRPGLRRSLGELRGELRLQGPGGRFTLTAKADRVDELANGRLAIVDYKTGAVPSAKEVASGYAPQLPLEAAIAARGGFEGLPAGAAAELAYWRLSGGDPPGEVRTLAGEPAELAAQALAGLERLIALFDDPATPYHARPRPERAPRHSDYAHLARVREWSAAGDGESG